MAQLKEYEPYRFYAFVQLRFLGLSEIETELINLGNNSSVVSFAQFDIE